MYFYSLLIISCIILNVSVYYRCYVYHYYAISNQFRGYVRIFIPCGTYNKHFWGWFCFLWLQLGLSIFICYHVVSFLNTKMFFIFVFVNFRHIWWCIFSFFLCWDYYFTPLHNLIIFSWLEFLQRSIMFMYYMVFFHLHIIG